MKTKKTKNIRLLLIVACILAAICYGSLHTNILSQNNLKVLPNSESQKSVAQKISKIDKDVSQEDSQISSSLFNNNEIDSLSYLYNYDDSADFIYIIFKNSKGYAILANYTYELLEYSMSNKLPFNNNDKIKYYGGPNKYYYKNEEEFVNLVTNETFIISKTESLNFSKHIRNSFLINNNEQINLKNNNFKKFNDNLVKSNGSPNNPPIDESNWISPSNGANYIKNSEYFLTKGASPTHGKNNDGTCTTVATQLMLSYNNYYNDRRIIAPEHLNGNWNNSGEDIYDANSYGYPEQNPNACVDPTRKTSYTLGSNQAFHDILLSRNIVGQISSSAKNLRSYLNSRNINYNVSVDYTSFGATSINSTIILREINNNRPLVLATSNILNGTPYDNQPEFNHAVLAYGYQTLSPYPDNPNKYLGYIVHMGWDSNGWGDNINVWTNASWYYGYINLQINHTHNYFDTSLYVNYTHKEFRCVTCGHRMIDEMYTTNSTGETITGIRYPVNSDFLIIPSKINGIPITTIGESAFQDSDVAAVGFEDYNTLTLIEPNAFSRCPNLVLIRIPDNVTKIGMFAFAGGDIMTVNYFGTALQIIDVGAFSETILGNSQLPSSVTTLKGSAFYNSNLGKNFRLSPGSQLTTISSGAFGNNPLIKRLLLPQTVKTIIGSVFTGCSSLTIYTEHNSKPSDWSSNWHSDRPIIWGCTLSSDKSYVTSFIKSPSTVMNSNAINGISEPYREDYVFDGWYSSADLTGIKYMDVTKAPDGKLYCKWKSSCISEGSLITLADGSQKPVEELTGNEQLLVWNLWTGSFDTAPILFIDRDKESVYEVINLGFSDGTSVKVISEHAFWDFDLNKYVFLRRDAAQYIGHWFNKQTTDADGNMIWIKVQLISVDIQNEVTTAWSPVTYGHLCYYVNGMLSMPGATEGLINIFDINPDTMTVDTDAYLADIAEYGLLSYDDVAEIMSEEVFEAFGGQYLLVSIGKGLTTWEEIYSLLDRYADLF